MCVVRKAKCLIDGFHLVQENSLLTAALSSLLRRKGVCICVCMCMYGREREREKGRQIKKTDI